MRAWPATRPSGPPRVRRPSAAAAALAGTCVLAATLSGCGKAARSAVCPPEATQAMARYLSVPAAAVAPAASTGANTMPQCSFSARLAGAVPVHVTANIDTAPQPYTRLERTAVEAAQQFSTVLHATPQDIPGLGLDADWFPDQQQLMTTDGVRLITVSVSWAKVSQPRKQGLAAAIARRYLSRR